jgi:hypothetical protein
MGETAIDEETFTEYLTAMRDHYTADKVRSWYSLTIVRLLTDYSIIC